MMKKSIKNVIKTLCLIMTLLFLCQIYVVPEIQGTVNVEAASRKTKKNAMNGCIRTWVSTVLMFICTNMRSY